MLYMCLISYDPTMPFEGLMLQQEHAALEQEMRDRGVYVSGAGLLPVEAGSSVRLRDGKPVVTDGPFAESKEVAGGYYLIDCATSEEAVAWAARIPTEKRSWVDVRPIALFHPNVERIAAMARA